MRFGSIAACAAVAPLLTAAAQPVRLKPSTRWVVEYAENSCRLSRSFGSGEDETVLRFESDSPDQVDMVIVGKPLPTGDGGVPTKFLPVEGKIMTGQAVRSGSGRPALLISTVWLSSARTAAKLDAEKKRRELTRGSPPDARDLAEEAARRSDRQAFADATVAIQVGRSIILETGPLGDAIRAFDECSRVSLRDWGVDPDLEDKIVRPVWAENEGRWLNSDDYPAKMLDDNQQSEVRARVLVDASGRVTKCTSLSHFRLPAFNDVVCNGITKRARFHPAELADGTKVPSYYTVRVNFRIAQ